MEQAQRRMALRLFFSAAVRFQPAAFIRKSAASAFLPALMDVPIFTLGFYIFIM
ncbi:MAG: hypothetical protein K2H09_05665 [Treponemataceae bacterium]|nr:hypothetical protein [Treponemataceae bacterium]